MNEHERAERRRLVLRIRRYKAALRDIARECGSRSINAGTATLSDFIRQVLTDEPGELDIVGTNRPPDPTEPERERLLRIESALINLQIRDGSVRVAGGEMTLTEFLDALLWSDRSAGGTRAIANSASAFDWLIAFNCTVQRDATIRPDNWCVLDVDGNIVSRGTTPIDAVTNAARGGRLRRKVEGRAKRVVMFGIGDETSEGPSSLFGIRASYDDDGNGEFVVRLHTRTGIVGLCRCSGELEAKTVCACIAATIATGDTTFAVRSEGSNPDRVECPDLVEFNEMSAAVTAADNLLRNYVWRGQE